MNSILLCDNQDLTHAGWRCILNDMFPLLEVNSVAAKSKLLELLVTHSNSVVILDYTLFDFDNINELLILQSRFEEVRWILCSEELSDDFIKNLLFASNSFSVLMKDSSKEEFIGSLRESLKGNRYIGNSVSNFLLENSKSMALPTFKQVLTITEQEILKDMALGKTTKEIAAIRFVSTHTIMTHRKNIFRKIQVNNVHEATKYAMRVGIVDMTEYYI